MWKEFKFAINPMAGDTKPVHKEESDSKSASKSLLKEDSPYGEIGKDHDDDKSSTYAAFSDI